MATPPGDQATLVIDRLAANPRKYSFIQAVRLLELCSRDLAREQGGFFHHVLKVVPELSLGHPSTDIASLVRTAAQTRKAPDSMQPGHSSTSRLPLYTLTATFLSLYGASSPLPTFYTEELLEEMREDCTVSREFLDIINQPLYELYYRAYNKYKIALRTRELGDRGLLDLQYTIIGFGGHALRRSARSDERDLRFASLFTRHTRSAFGLKQYLSLFFGHAAIDIEECVERHPAIPVDQRCRLGTPTAFLGDAVLGTQLRDDNGAFRIHLRELDTNAILRFTPGGDDWDALHAAVRRYLYQPLSYTVALHAKEDSLPAATLDKNPPRLGMNAFLAAPSKQAAASYSYYEPFFRRQSASFS